MQVVHFTLGATDPLSGIISTRASLVRLASTDTVEVSCLHLAVGGVLNVAPGENAQALLLVQGQMKFLTREGTEIDFYAGMGAMLEAGEPYAVRSETGAIAISVNAKTLTPTAEGISTPIRISGQRWQGEPPVNA